MILNTFGAHGRVSSEECSGKYGILTFLNYLYKNAVLFVVNAYDSSPRKILWDPQLNEVGIVFIKGIQRWLTVGIWGLFQRLEGQRLLSLEADGLLTVFKYMRDFYAEDGDLLFSFFFFFS